MRVMAGVFLCERAAVQLAAPAPRVLQLQQRRVRQDGTGGARELAAQRRAGQRGLCVGGAALHQAGGDLSGDSPEAEKEPGRNHARLVPRAICATAVPHLHYVLG